MVIVSSRAKKSQTLYFVLCNSSTQINIDDDWKLITQFHRESRHYDNASHDNLHLTRDTLQIDGPQFRWRLRSDVPYVNDPTDACIDFDLIERFVFRTYCCERERYFFQEDMVISSDQLSL